MSLTEQLGKTVLYGDIALSPDGKNVAWVQSTAATTTKETYVRAAGGDSPATKIDIGGAVVTASITNEAVDELKLAKGQTAYAVIKASDVMVAVD